MKLLLLMGLEKKKELIIKIGLHGTEDWLDGECLKKLEGENQK